MHVNMYPCTELLPWLQQLFVATDGKELCLSYVFYIYMYIDGLHSANRYLMSKNLSPFRPTWMHAIMGGYDFGQKSSLPKHHNHFQGP